MALGSTPQRHARLARLTSERVVIRNAGEAARYAGQQKCSLAFKRYETALEGFGAMTAHLASIGKRYASARSRAARALVVARRALGDRCIYLGGR